MDQNTNQPYGQPNEPYGQWNEPYGQWNQPYGQPQHDEVKDMFCIALLIVLPLRMLLSMVSSVMTFASMTDISYSSVMDGSYIHQITAITANPVYAMLASLSNVLLIAYIVFVIMDIMAVRRANYKTTGLILFAIFLNYGYYIWRAHVLGRKKTGPVIYTVCYALLGIVNVVITVIYTMSMSLGMIGTMY